MIPQYLRLQFVALWALLLALAFSTAHAAAPPQVGISTPAHSGFDKADWKISGTAVHPWGIGFLNNRVTLSISRSGQYWNGSAWTNGGSPIELHAVINADGTWTYPGASGETLPTDEGEYAISASVTDTDNVSSVAVAGGESGNNQISFRLDTTSPDCAMISPASGTGLSAVGATLTITGTASDSYPAQPNVTLLIKSHRNESYWDGQHWMWNPDEAGIPATYTSAHGWIPSKPMPKAGWDENHGMTNGSYTFTATARDAAGNTTRRDATVTVDLAVSYPLTPFGSQQITPLSADGITQLELVDYSPLPPDDERTQSPSIVRIAADNSLVTGVNMHYYQDTVYHPSAAVIKHAANGSELWRKERELHSVTITSGDTPTTTRYERWSPADPWLVINASDYTPHYRLSAMELDAAGNTYAGFDLTFLPPPGSYNTPVLNNVSIVAKFDSNGNLVWRSRIENPYESNQMMSLKPLADGSAVALVSNTWQTYSNYWPYTYYSGGQSVVIRVGATSGNFKHQFGYSDSAAYNSTPVGIEVDPAGNLVVVSTESVSADATHMTLHKIRRIAADGTILKTVDVPTSASPESWRRMRLDRLNGDVFISGVATENTSGLSRSTVLKFDLDNAAGSELAWRSFGPATSGSNSAAYLAVSNNSVTVAETAAESNSSNAANLVSVVTFDKNGQLLWSRQNADPALKNTDWGSGSGLTLHHMITDAAGNVYLACKGSRGGLIKIAANGDIQFVKPFPEGYTSPENGSQFDGQMQVLADNSIAVLVRSSTTTPERTTVLKISNPANVALPLSIGEGSPPDQFVQIGSLLTLAVSNTGSPATYQWEKDDANGIPQPLAGATGASLTIANATEAHSGLYRVTLTSTVNPADVLTSRKANVTVYSAVSLPVALDTPGLIWETSAPDSWIGQTAVTSDGVDAAMNAALGSYESSWMQTTVAGPGTFSFQWKTLHPANDTLNLYLDPIGTADGSSLSWTNSENFAEGSIQVPAGTHTLRFKFSSGHVAGNLGIVDRIVFVRDSQAPAVALEVPAPGSTGFSLAAVSGSATATIETVTFSIRRVVGGLYWNGSDWAATLSELATHYNAVAGTWNHGVVLPGAASLAAGDYEFTVYGRNSSGVNVSSSSIATLSPNGVLGVSIDAPTNGGSLNGVASVRGSASSQAQQVTLRIQRLSDNNFWNGGEWLAYPTELSTSSIGGAGGWYHADLPEFDPGDYQFTATATDVENNTAQDSATASAQFEAGPLTSLVIAPATADVTSASRTLTVRLAADHPVDFGTVTLTAPSGQTISGSFGENNLSGGAYEFTLNLPQHREAGAWSVSAYLQGADFGDSNYSPSGQPFPSGSTTEVLIVNTGPQDLSAPQVTSLTMTPSPATVTTASQDITVTIGVSDDVGLDQGNITLRSPGGNRSLYGYLSAENRISGTAANGIYQFHISIPAHAEPGLWSANLYLSDVSQRSTHYNGTSSPAFPSGIDGTLTVVNTGGIDNEAPVLTALSFSTASVDVSQTSQQVTVTLQVTDDLAGLKEGTLILENPTSPQSLSFPFGAAQRSSGTPTNGTYSLSLNIPKYAPAGTWNARVTLADFSDSSSSYGSGYYDTPFPAGLTTQLQIQNSGQTDTVAPTLASLSFSRSTVDVSSTSQSVTVTMQLGDDLSGVAGGYVGFWKGGIQHIAHFDTTAGLNGTYQITVTIPQAAATGTWTFGLAIRDVFSNWRAYGAASYYQPAPLPAGAPAVLTVSNSAQNSFDQWVQIQFPAGTPGEQRVFNADPDADGVSNLLEYAFNMPPMNSGGREKLPAAYVQRDAQGRPTHLVMTYNERIGSSDLVYKVPVSADMNNWDNTGMAVERVGATPNADGTTQRVTVRVITGTTQEKFIRVMVEHATP